MYSREPTFLFKLVENTSNLHVSIPPPLVSPGRIMGGHQVVAGCERRSTVPTNFTRSSLILTATARCIVYVYAHVGTLFPN